MTTTPSTTTPSTTTPSTTTPSTTSAPTRSSTTIKVWDPLVRVFHWSLVLLFTIAFASEDGPEIIHIYAGYGISLLVFFRLLWGFIGTRYARFSSFYYDKSTQKNYLKGLLHRQPKHYTGHNPAGGLMVFILLGALAMQCFLGMVMLAGGGEGPLANTFLAVFGGGITEELHEILGNGLLLLVAVHVAGVLISSLLHKENLVRAMITGKKAEHKEYSDVEPH